MRTYNITPKRWNEMMQDFFSDIDNSETASTYKEAVAKAKRFSKTYDRADIDFYELKKSECIDDTDMKEKWMFNRADSLRWKESYEHGKQVPVLSYQGANIWRWNLQGYPADLKPRKEASHDRA